MCVLINAFTDCSKKVRMGCYIVLLNLANMPNLACFDIDVARVLLEPYISTLFLLVATFDCLYTINVSI